MKAYSFSSSIKTRETKKRLYCIVLILFILLFVFSVLMLSVSCIKTKEERVGLKKLSDTANAITSAPPVNTINIPNIEKTSVMLEQYRYLYEKNNDFIGWIKIEGTNIDYPVMYTKRSDYYIDHDFEKQESKSGTPFIDSRCSVNTFGTNTIIYGHNMKDDSMFSDLLKYEKLSFYNEHPEIYFNTLYAEQRYRIIAAFRCKIYYADEKVYKHYNFLNAKDEEEFDEYIAHIKKLSVYDTGETASLGDELISLCTCAYHTENGQFIVVAKKIVDNDSF